ncbi:MAG: hypothetical protein ACTS27_10850 [Phycisphaerales bacterium]
MRRIAGILGGLAVALAGCAGPRAPGFVDPAEARAVEWTGEPIDLAAAYPLDAAPTRYAAGPSSETDDAIRRVFTALHDGRVELTETSAATGELRSRVILSRNGQGDVVIHETARPARDLLTRFDPPMLFAPAGLLPGETVEQTLRVETFTLDDPPKPKGAGEGTHTLTRRADRAMPLEPGDHWAELESRLRVRIGPASVESTSTYLLNAETGTNGPGLRLRRSARTVRVLGFVVEDEAETLRRVGSPAAGDSADTP